MIRLWMIAPIGLALLTTACGETKGQRAATGATGGAVTGAVIGGPVGAAVGAGAGAAGGIYRNEVDQTVDKGTEKATRRVQEARGSEGQPGQGSDQAAEYVASVNREQDQSLTNEDVHQAQIALQSMGLYDGQIDGIYGPRTIDAVGEFQTKQNLPRTRALDEQTMQQLQQAAEAGGSTPAGQSGQVGERPAGESGAPPAEQPAEQTQPPSGEPGQPPATPMP